jgi:predicted enzyme related to lactoylglutathione lyase
MDWKIELLSVPVADIDRAKEFYVDRIGFTLDHDHTVSEEIRFVQITPPGSACSFVLATKGMSEMAPGTQQGIQAVVPDADQALRHLQDNGVECRGVEEFPWGRFVFFSDPDGNGWALQQIVRPG